MTTLAFPPPPPGRPERALIRDVDALAAEVPAELPAGLALERARIMLEQAERLRVLTLQALSDVDGRELFTLEGAPSMPAWVRTLAVAAVGRTDVATARRLRAVPKVEAAMLAGKLSVDAATQVARAIGKARPFLDRPDGRIDGQPAEDALHGTLVDGVCMLLDEQRGGAAEDDPDQNALLEELVAIAGSADSQRDRLESALVLFAERCEPELLHSGLGLLLDALLPAEHDRRAAEAEDRAGLDLRRRSDGPGWTIRGELDDETGELLHTVLTAEQQVDTASPADTDAWRAAAQEPDVDRLEPELWPAALPRPRSRREQRHAALKAGLRRLLDSGALGLRDKARPHLLITVGLDYLNGLPGALPARAASGARWTRRQLRHIACGSVFTRIVLGARGRAVEVSHTGRTLKGFERLIQHVEWGGTCSRAGCARGPASGHKLVPHHVNPYSKTGTTELQDTVPLCDLDHHELHDDSRVLRLKDGRWIGPDGWIEPPAGS